MSNVAKSKTKPSNKHGSRGGKEVEERTVASKGSCLTATPPTKKTSSSKNLKKKPSKDGAVDGVKQKVKKAASATKVTISEDNVANNNGSNKLPLQQKPQSPNIISPATSDPVPGTPGLTPTPVKAKEKWVGEEAALSWLRKLGNLKMVDEYVAIKGTVTVDQKRCVSWAANMAKNRHPDYKCYDDSRVVVVEAKSDYINATKINIPNFSRPTFLAQLPKLNMLDAVEEFWRMIFKEQCTEVHLIAQPGEVEESLEKLFAQDVGRYFYANGFFVNTRKVEKYVKKDPTTPDMFDSFMVELLPEGCSNSLMCQVFVHDYWKDQCGPGKYYAPMKAAQLIAKNDNDLNNPVTIVSVKGAGRNASLLALAIVVSSFLKGVEPKIPDIVRSIREQRPMSVDSIAQYTSLYSATAWWLKAKMPYSKEVVERAEDFKTKCRQQSSSIMSQTTGDEKCA